MRQKKNMKSNDELNDKTGFSTTKKGKADEKMRSRTTTKDGGNKDAKLRQVPKSKYGKDEEGTEPKSARLRAILTSQGAIKKRSQGRPKKK